MAEKALVLFLSLIHISLVAKTAMSEDEATGSMVRIRIATPADAKEILDIYAPYIRETAVTFEYEVPTLTDFTQRMERTLSLIHISKENAMMGGTVALSVILAIAIFMILPYYLSVFCSRFIASDMIVAVLEGIQMCIRDRNYAVWQ